jgi:mannitol-1-phosphate 5-dehydrogenase
MNNLHFGAGNIGRGFIGLLLQQQGVHVTFVDVNEDIVESIQRRHEYVVELLSTPPKQIRVSGVDALLSTKDEAKVVAMMENVDIITTSVGVNVLPLIAPLIAKGLKARTNPNPVHVIACENALSASSLLRAEVLKHLDDLPSNTAFPNAAVDRIVPQQRHSDPLFVQVEPFFEWVIETKDLVAPLLLKDVHFVEDLAPYIERKLFTVNTGHCATAYAGYQKKYSFISEAISDPEVESFVRTVLSETSHYLIQHYGFDAKTHQEYVDNTVERFKNSNIVDEVVRVGRSPLRKLSADDRLVKPAREVHALGKAPNALVEAIAYGLLFDYSLDTEANDIQSRIMQHLGSAISTITGIPVTDPLHLMIVDAYQRLASQS